MNAGILRFDVRGVSHTLGDSGGGSRRPNRMREAIVASRGSVRHGDQAGGRHGSDGCRTEGERLFSGCRQCPIRACARQRKVESCAFCGEYGCERLIKFLKRTRMPKQGSNSSGPFHEPTADSARKGMNGPIMHSRQETDAYVIA